MKKPGFHIYLLGFLTVCLMSGLFLWHRSTTIALREVSYTSTLLGHHSTLIHLVSLLDRDPQAILPDEFHAYLEDLRQTAQKTLTSGNQLFSLSPSSKNPPVLDSWEQTARAKWPAISQDISATVSPQATNSTQLTTELHKEQKAEALEHIKIFQKLVHNICLQKPALGTGGTNRLLIGELLCLSADLGLIAISGLRFYKQNPLHVEVPTSTVQDLSKNLELIISNLNIPFIKLDADGQIQSFAGEICQTILTDLKISPGNYLVDSLPASARNNFVAALSKIRSGSGCEIFPISVVHSREIAKQYEFSLLPSGENGFLVILRDKTENDRLKESLEEKDFQFQLLANRVDEVFFICDLQTFQVHYISPSYERIWGRRCEDLYKNPYDFVSAIHPDDQPMVTECFRKLQQGEAIDATYRVIKPDGKVVIIRDRTNPIKDRGNQDTLYFGIAEGC